MLGKNGELARIAKLDPATGDAGIFKVSPKKDAPAQQLVKVSGQTTFKYTVPFALDATALRYFVALLAAGTKDPETVDLFGKSEELLAYDDASQDAVAIEVSAYNLAQHAGVKWGKGVSNSIKKNLEKLGAVSSSRTRMETVKGTEKEVTEGPFPLLKYRYVKDGRDSKIKVVISPFHAQAILNQAHRFTRFNMDEIRQIHKPAALIIHIVMSTRFGGKDREEERVISYDKLIEMCYGENSSSAQRRDRKRVIREALKELDSLEYWFVDMESNENKVLIARHTEKSFKNLMISKDRIRKRFSDPDDGN